MKTYYIFTIEGDDCVSQAFPTHKAATWNLWNSKEYADESGEPYDRRKVYYVKEFGDEEEDIECPSCGANYPYTGFDGDTYVCDKCFHCW